MSSAGDVSLQDAFIYIEHALQARLESAEFPDHPTAKGDVSETAWRKTFARYLPARFRVGSGFVIDSRGKSSRQVDCIIYDNVHTPTLWGEGGFLHIPAEAVHAVFEIKPEVNKKYLRVASEIVESVRLLHRTSVSYMGSGQENPPKDPIHIVGGLLATRVQYKAGLAGSAFGRAIGDVQRLGPVNRNLDIVFTAFGGYADYFHSGFPTERPPYTDTAKGAVARGLFRLVRALLVEGTVAAIDLARYLE